MVSAVYIALGKCNKIQIHVSHVGLIEYTNTLCKVICGGTCVYWAEPSLLKRPGHKVIVPPTHVLILFETTTLDVLQSQLRLMYARFVHLDFNTVVWWT